MGRARGIWDAASHPRNGVGRFASTAGAKRALSGHTVASAITASYQPRSSGRKRAITKWEPGIYGGRDARLQYRWFEGKVGPVLPHPRGGTHQPMLEFADWKLVGHEPKPAGYTHKALSAAKARRRRRY